MKCIFECMNFGAVLFERKNCIITTQDSTANSRCCLVLYDSCLNYLNSSYALLSTYSSLFFVLFSYIIYINNFIRFFFIIII